MRSRRTWRVVLALAMLRTETAAAAPIGGDQVLALLATCERECSGARACVVTSGEAAACSGADCWTSEDSGGLRAMCVAVTDERHLAQVEDAVRAVSLVGRRTQDVALDQDASRRWRRAELVSVENVDASQLVPQLASFSALSTLSLRNASLSAFPAQIFSLSSLRRLDLRGNGFSSPVRLSESERRFLSTQLEAFEIDASSLDTQCDDPQPIGELYAVCDRRSTSSIDADTSPLSSSGSADGLHARDDSAAVDNALLLAVSTGSAVTDASSSSSSGGVTSIDTLTWVVVSSVVVVLCLIVLVAYCYTKWDCRLEEEAEGGDVGEPEAEQATSGVRRFLSFRSRRHRSRLQSVSKWHDDPELCKWAIDPAALVPLRQIGSGAFSTVWLARYMTEMVALKRFLPVASGSNSSNDSQRDFHDAFASELSLMATLAHPKIVALVGVAWSPPPLSPHVDIATDDRDKVALVVEYMERGDLRAYLNATKESDAGAGWSRRKIAIAADIAEAIAYLHAQSPPVLHRDVTSRNILLDANYTAKLADFGLSRRLRLGSGDGQDANTLAMTKGVGTSRWIAPEVLAGDGAYSPAVDVYSFGVVLAELDSHEPPFCDVSLSNGKPLSEHAVLKLLCAGALAPEVSEACPKPVATLMLECLSADPRARPAASYAASRLRAMLERLRRVSDVGDDITSGDSGSVIEMGVDGGIISGGRVFGLNTMDSFLGIDDTCASASGTSGGDSKRSDSLAASQYSLMQDSN